MSGVAKAGEWVEVRRTVLGAGERAPQVPADTASVALEMRVKGRLIGDARVGDEVEIETPAGRRLRGTLAAINPPYPHGFGAPVPALSGIGAELRAMLAKARR